MKDINIKVWPELIGYLPALIPLPKIEEKENGLYLDFSNCNKINSSGLNIFLIHLLKYVKFDGVNRGWHSDELHSLDIIEQVDKFNFFKILNLYCPNISLFNAELAASSSAILEENLPISSEQMISFPIYMINLKAYTNRRKALEYLKEWLYNKLETYYLEYDFILPQLASVITEIAKNSADHTDDNAFIGLDIVNNNIDSIKICFSIGDLGVGINQNIKDHLPNNVSESRYKFWDLTQTYREALSRGFTTKEESKENKGLGMSLILDGAKGIKLILSVFDAKSRGLLNNITSTTHSDIRKNFFNTGKDVGFYYYGELIATKV